MKARPSKAWDRVHDASRRALLAAEGTLRSDLDDALRACRERHQDISDDETAAHRVAADLLATLPTVIMRGRVRARQASAASLARQCVTATRMGVRGLPAVNQALATADDKRRALAASKSFSAAWLRSALEAIDARRKESAPAG